MTETQSKFIRTLNGEKFGIPPIWFMRQAGRYLPEYLAVRKKAGSFLDLCYNSELARDVTIQPIERFDLDAAILFADILLIPDALGQQVSFVAGEGPQLSPCVSMADLDAFEKADILDFLAPVFETVSLTRKALPRDKALIGFAGAPWTVATYMIAGGPIKDPTTLRRLYYSDREFLSRLIDLLTDRTIAYLNAQVEAGADAVQIFDTWAGGLPWPVLEAVSLNPIAKIAEGVKAVYPDIPVIAFPKGVGEKVGEYALDSNTSGVGIDFSMDIAFARKEISPHAVVQGGLDPLLVVPGGTEMKKAATGLINMFHDVPYVFNLGHGFVPETPPENVAELVRHIRQAEANA